ncbi:hypothetical protein FBQ99_11260 [Chloroflexi bacterium CFX2]|nr:hypothetical protein [Chloroflexi bacterium CFX2]
MADEFPLYNKNMTGEPLRTLRFLLARLERISADSVVAHRASGVRGAMLRALEQLESGRPVSGQKMKRLIDEGYLLLEKAAAEKVR